MDNASFNGVKAGLISLLAPLVLSGLTSVCHAQESAGPQEPLIAKKQATRQVGDVTSSLLAMQVNGSNAGPALPMLGATSSLSWDRYKESFTYKIPESFERAVSKSNTSGQ